MKKVTSFLCAVLVCAAASFLSGCNKTPAQEEPTEPDVELTIGDVTVGYLRATAVPNSKVSSYALILAAQNVWDMQLDMHGTEEDLVATLMENDPSCVYTDGVENQLIVLNGSLDFDYWLVLVIMDEDGELYAIEKNAVRSPSYTEGAPEATMTIEVLEVTPTTVRLVHTPDENTVGYYTLNYTKAEYDAMIEIAQTDPSISEIYPDPEDYVIYYLRWSGWRWFEREDNVWEGLTPGTEYVAVGAPFNVNGFEQGAGKLAVIGDGIYREIDIATCGVGMTLLLQQLDDLDHAIDVVSRLAHDIRTYDVQQGFVMEEGLCVEGGDVPDRAACLPCALRHLVLAIIAIPCQVADIGYVHDMLELVAGMDQRPVQEVLEDVGPEVADMGVVVYRRSAAIESYLAFFKWYEVFEAACECVVESDHGLSYDCLQDNNQLRRQVQTDAQLAPWSPDDAG